jgi:hypothetical protein
MNKDYNRALLERTVIRFFDENNILPTSESVEFIAILAEFMMSGPEWQAPDLDAISMRLENERLQCA